MKKPEMYIREKYIESGIYGDLEVRDNVHWHVENDEGWVLCRIRKRRRAIMWEREMGCLLEFKDGSLRTIRPTIVQGGIQNHMYILKPSIQAQILKYKL